MVQCHARALHVAPCCTSAMLTRLFSVATDAAKTVQSVAVCYSVLQCGAMWCSVLHRRARRLRVTPFCTLELLARQRQPRVLQCVAVCCSVLLCAAVCCSVLQCVAVCCCVLLCVAVCCSALLCVAGCCCVLQCVAVCCNVLQCVAVSSAWITHGAVLRLRVSYTCARVNHTTRVNESHYSGGA